MIPVSLDLPLTYRVTQMEVMFPMVVEIKGHSIYLMMISGHIICMAIWDNWLICIFRFQVPIHYRLYYFITWHFRVKQNLSRGRLPHCHSKHMSFQFLMKCLANYCKEGVIILKLNDRLRYF